MLYLNTLLSLLFSIFLLFDSIPNFQAIMRTGRIDKKIYVPLPDEGSREKIFQLRLNGMRVEEEVLENVGSFVEQSRGYSGAEVSLAARFHRVPYFFGFLVDGVVR